MVSTFRETIIFFEKLGIYDVVLPFLLVFSIVFAILEKSKIFGLEKKYDRKGSEYVESPMMTRKNINAMVAFVIAFFVVASTQLVAIINKALANIVLLLLLSFSFLLLFGSFAEDRKDKAYFLPKPWNTIMEIVMAIGIVLIFLNATGWLDSWYRWVVGHWDGTTFVTIVLLVITILTIVFVTSSGGGSPDGKPKKEGD